MRQSGVVAPGSAQGLARARFAEIAALPDASIDLGEAAFVIAAEEYPALDVRQCLLRLDDLAAQVRPRLASATGAVERLALLTDYLHRERNLRGNEEEYYDPRNSYLNEVLDRGTGIPISLSVLYMEVGKRTGVPLEGIGFPAHFLLRLASAREGVYLDPFHGGSFLTEEDCRALLERLTGGQVPFDPRFLQPVSNRQILVRMLNNLKGIYLRQGAFEKAVAACDRILLLTPGSAREYRDRGAIYAQLEAFRLALADFEEYLARGAGEDRREVSETVEVLRRRVELLN
jgi:regulator of sirC expression with transglutaminase-like and TPR domain